MTVEEVMKEKLRKAAFGMPYYENNTDISKRVPNSKHQPGYKPPKQKRNAFTDEVAKLTVKNPGPKYEMEHHWEKQSELKHSKFIKGKRKTFIE
jgi:hypothetical protein